MPTMTRRPVLFALGALLAGRAAALEAPRGAVVLTIHGQVRMPNQGQRASFDMPMLEAFEQHEIRTRTPWYSTERQFTGPLLREVLAAAGARGETIRAVAINDYQVDIPFDDALRYDVVVARLLDGKPMAVRDKGPLFIMYPFERHPELRNAVYLSRCAWQLNALEVR